MLRLLLLFSLGLFNVHHIRANQSFVGAVTQKRHTECTLIFENTYSTEIIVLTCLLDSGSLLIVGSFTTWEPYGSCGTNL